MGGIEECAVTDVGVRNGVAKKERRNVIKSSHFSRADFLASSTLAEGIDCQKPRVKPCIVRS